MTFEQWMERSGVTAPDPDDDIVVLGYVDQVCAWAAEHDPEGWARWEESLLSRRPETSSTAPSTRACSPGRSTGTAVRSPTGDEAPPTRGRLADPC